jgi:subtilisin family serine protease
MKNKIALGIFAVAALTGCVKEYNQQNDQAPFLTSAAAPATSDKIQAEEYKSDEIIVKFREGTSESNKNQLLAMISGKMKKQVHTKAMELAGDREGFYVVKTTMGVTQALTHAKAFSGIEFAEPNYIYTHAATANDPYATVDYLWGMHTGFGSQATTAWGNNHTGSKAVYVGIIDEGVDYTHPDLTDNVWTNPGEIAGNGIDDDGDGYADDVHGWDFYNNDNSTFDGAEDDHGTHVAGTIGAKGNNGVGVAGMNWDVNIISAKFLGPNGGSLADAVEAIDYMVNLKKTKGINIVALNNSWGGGGYSDALFQAIERANQAGILFIAAAGNGNSAGVGYDIDKQKSYPASYSNANVIAVAAIDKNGALAKWSNYGAKSVDLGAPGVDVASTYPGNQYAYMSGTSMATPHVTGAAALYAATNGLKPTTASQAAVIKDAIITAAKNTKTQSLNRKTVTGGRLNVSGF